MNNIELNEDQLNQLKKIEVEMLKDFIDACTKLKLKYYIVAGTLLGAVRHQGFIPWDDDIDVALDREDYETFLQHGQQYLPSHLFLQTYKTDPAYPVGFAKIRNCRTTFIESSVGNLPMNHGIFIDIFPIDYCTVPLKPGFRIKKLLYSLRISDAFTSFEKPSLKVSAIRVFSKILYPSMPKTLDKQDALFRSVVPSEMKVNHYSAWGDRELVPADWYGEGTLLSFEGLPVRVPVEYDKLLTHVYGDYMTLPPIEKQKAHHYIDYFDPENPYTKYINDNK